MVPGSWAGRPWNWTERNGRPGTASPVFAIFSILTVAPKTGAAISHASTERTVLDGFIRLPPSSKRGEMFVPPDKAQWVVISLNAGGSTRVLGRIILEWLGFFP